MRVHVSRDSNSLIALGGSDELEERLSPGV
jgi:hypothetical protein